MSGVFQVVASFAIALCVLRMTPVVSAESGANVGGNRESAVDALLGAHQETGRPGMAVGIYRRGRLLYAQEYGLADLEHNVPNTAHTVFNLASVSKQFFAFSIALLAREGKVDLDADIRRYLPWMPDLGQRITVKHLVHHTSGLRDYIGLAALGGQDGGSLMRQQHVLNLLQRQRALNFAPGSEYEYSNSDYCLLAEILRSVSGQNPRDFMEARIFRPLGMTHTRVRDDLGEIVPNYAIGYEKRDGAGAWARAVYNRQAVGPGNILSTVEDLAKWAGDLANPTVGDRALMEQITAPGRLNDGTPVNYGFGLMRETVAGHRAIAHSGGISGFSAEFNYFPAEDFAVIVLANSGDADAGALAANVAGIYLSDDRKSSAPREPAVTRPARAELVALAGHYQNRDGRMIELEPQDQSMIARSASGRLGSLRFWADETFGLDSYRDDRFRRVRSPVGEIIALEEVRFDEGLSGSARGVRHLRVSPAPVSAAALSQLAGEYRSIEIDTSYTVAVESGRLTLSSLWLTEPQFFVPTTADHFDAQAGPLSELSLTVQRDAAGTTTGLILSQPGVRGLLLSKLPKGEHSTHARLGNT